MAERAPREAVSQAGRSTTSEDEDVVVALTTLPTRTAALLKALDSLLLQSVPCRIVLTVPRRCRRMPWQAYELDSVCERFPGVAVLRVTEDYGPLSKLAHVVAESLGSIIITADDDFSYPRDTVEVLLRSARERPDAALAFTGWNVANLTRGAAHPPWEYRQYVAASESVDVLEGYAAALYRAEFFDDQLLDFSTAPERSWWADDVWVSGHLARRGIPRVLVPRSVKPTAIEEPDALHALPGFSEANRSSCLYFRQRYGSW